MRTIINFPCNADILAGTLDIADGKTGLLIISGGNDIRSGAFGGQSQLAQYVQALGYPVFRFDRRGVGDSEGVNTGFENSFDDIAAALAAFRASAPQLRAIVGFGNCDAAAALALFPERSEFCARILANPWTIDTVAVGQSASSINGAAIRSRYWKRLKNPRSIFDLLSGRINIRKLVSGFMQAATPAPASRLATRIKDELAVGVHPITICLAAHDTTAMAFAAAWKSATFESLRHKTHIELYAHETASHSFADPPAREWLYAHVESVLKRQG